MSKCILIFEPSPFRRAGTTVFGPYSWFVAWVNAHLLANNHPFCEVRVVPTTAKVFLGDRQLWPREGQA
jgi:hypothetical protein